MVPTSCDHIANTASSHDQLQPPRTSPSTTPCAACKALRRRCADRCVLAPYFPPSEPLKFTTAHRVFGASNIIKFLQELPESQRPDAVSSMVYEATARIRDPVYGCAGAICHLQKHVGELQAQLAKAQAEVVNLRAHNANLVALICMDTASTGSGRRTPADTDVDELFSHGSGTAAGIGRKDDGGRFILDDGCNEGSIWETLWA